MILIYDFYPVYFVNFLVFRHQQFRVHQARPIPFKRLLFPSLRLTQNGSASGPRRKIFSSKFSPASTVSFFFRIFEKIIRSADLRFLTLNQISIHLFFKNFISITAIWRENPKPISIKCLSLKIFGYYRKFIF